MQTLKKSFIVALVWIPVHAGLVSAEQAAVSLPGTFPGSGGFPEPALPSDLPPAYPEWPERTFRTDIVPPPPDGPYMSSAMMEIMVFPEDTGGLRNEFREPEMAPPFFSGEMPWPETPERERPTPWVPESGEYHYVPEEIVRQLESQSPVMRPGFPARQPFPPRFPPPPPVMQPYYGYY